MFRLVINTPITVWTNASVCLCLSTVCLYVNILTLIKIKQPVSCIRFLQVKHGLFVLQVVIRIPAQWAPMTRVVWSMKRRPWTIATHPWMLTTPYRTQWAAISHQPNTHGQVEQLRGPHPGESLMMYKNKSKDRKRNSHTKMKIGYYLSKFSILILAIAYVSKWKLRYKCAF